MSELLHPAGNNHLMVETTPIGMKREVISLDEGVLTVDQEGPRKIHIASRKAAITIFTGPSIGSESNMDAVALTKSDLAIVDGPPPVPARDETDSIQAAKARKVARNLVTHQETKHIPINPAFLTYNISGSEFKYAVRGDVVGILTDGSLHYPLFSPQLIRETHTGSISLATSRQYLFLGLTDGGAEILPLLFAKHYKGTLSTSEFIHGPYMLAQLINSNNPPNADMLTSTLVNTLTCMLKHKLLGTTPHIQNALGFIDRLNIGILHPSENQPFFDDVTIASTTFSI